MCGSKPVNGGDLHRKTSRDDDDDGEKNQSDRTYAIASSLGCVIS